MRLPRDVRGEELARRLAVLGYRVVRQEGSHMRLSTEAGGVHRMTVVPGRSKLARSIAFWPRSRNITASPGRKY
jgi:predicted RNA binding protein YcfA (HicA-like mRNA interferase family)